MHELAWVLDHVGIAFHDLNDAESLYQRLGFHLTPRSIHSGTLTPDGPVVPMGSGNYCAMLNDGYIELLGTVDHTRPSFSSKMLNRYQGAHIIAFGCPDAEQAYARLKEQEPRTQPPSVLERDAAFGPHNETLKRARFRNIYLEDGVFPGARLIFIEHQSPQVLWQPHLLQHPNTAQGLTEVVLCVEDVAQTAAHLGRMLEVEYVISSSDIAKLTVARGRVYFLSPQAVPQWVKGVNPPAVPSVVGFGVEVANLDTCKQLLRQADIPFNTHAYPAIWLDPEETGGTVLSFTQKKEN